MTTPDRQLYRLRDVEDSQRSSWTADKGGDDVDLTFKWVNDPLARKMTFNQEPISSGTHWTWFRNRVKEGNWWILEEFNRYGDTVPIGQIRFDKRVGVLGIYDVTNAISKRLYEHFIVSIFIAEEFRGKGYATELLALGLARIERKGQKLPCVAYIKSENNPSIRLFRGMAFSNTFTLSGKNYATIDGDDHITLVRYWE